MPNFVSNFRTTPQTLTLIQSPEPSTLPVSQRGEIPSLPLHTPVGPFSLSLSLLCSALSLSPLVNRLHSHARRSFVDRVIGEVAWVGRWGGKSRRDGGRGTADGRTDGQATSRARWLGVCVCVCVCVCFGHHELLALKRAGCAAVVVAAAVVVVVSTLLSSSRANE